MPLCAIKKNFNFEQKNSFEKGELRSEKEGKHFDKFSIVDKECIHNYYFYHQ